MSDGSTAANAARTTIYDYWMTLYRRRGLIFLLSAVAVVSSLLVSSRIQQVYRSQASFYVLRSVPGQTEAAREFAVAIPLVKVSTVHAFAEILNGRDAKLRILEDFPGVHLEDLGSRPIVTASSNGLLNVTINHHDPELAANLANAFVSYFRKIVWAPSLNEAVQKRARIETELADVTRRLDDARSVRRQMTEDPTSTKAATELATLEANKFSLDKQISDMEIRLDSAKQEIDSLRLTSLRERRTVLQSEVEGLEIRLKGFRQIRANLAARIRRGTDLAADLEVQDSAIATLRREQSTLEKTLDGLNIGSLQERNLELVTQTAAPANKPYVPNTTQNAILALAIALTFGSLFAMFLDIREQNAKVRRTRQHEFERWAGRLLLSDRKVTSDGATT